jgi:glycosyltransferase involved in cell wall biosynthesis
MNLLFLTSNFPYHPGEQFLEGEINILAQNFNEITIVPLHVDFFSAPNSPKRIVPKNVEILLLPRSLPKLKIIDTAIEFKGFFAIVKDLTVAAFHGKIFRRSKLRGICVQYFVAAMKAFFISKSVNVNKYDIIYSYWGAGNGLILDFLKCTCSHKTVFVSRVHGYDLYAERQNLKRLPFQKKLLNTCDVVAPCSEQGEAYLKKRYGTAARNVRHFYLGVATQNIINQGSEDDVLRIVTCSFITPIKRLELVILALKLVSRHVIWTHIGDGLHKEEIVEISNQLPPNIKTEFIGHLENKDVLEYYLKNPVDLFVNVSSHEGVPVSIMEAISFGIEPVATKVGGVPELVKPAFGTLFDSNFRPDQLANIIQNHKNSKKRRIKAQEFQQINFSFTNYQSFASYLFTIAEIKKHEH